MPDAGPHERALIVAHELIWDLMEALTASGHLRPLAGNDGERPAPPDLREHLLLRLQ
jgi:hypothetical protein